MAYVAITQELTNDIRRKLGSLKDAELSTAMASETYIETQIKQDAAFCAEVQALVLDTMWKGMEDIRAVAGSRLNKIERTAHVAFVTTLDDGRTVKLSNLADVPPPLNGGWPLFSGSNDGYSNTPRLTVTVATTHPVFAQAASNLEVRQEATDRWDRVLKQVLDFIGKCKSLNEAVKLWPDIVKYIPTKYVERLEKKSERVKPEQSDAAKALAAIDMDAVAASVTLARMAGGKL